MVEPEMAFFDLTDNMDLAERFLKRIFRDALDHCAEDMQFFNERDRQDDDRHAAKRSSTATSVRLPYTEAVEILEKSRRDVRVPGRRGASTCNPSTSAT